jgi:hypothetical protein
MKGNLRAWCLSREVETEFVDPPSVPVWDSVGPSPPLCSFTTGAGTPRGTCGCTGKLVDPSNFGGAWRFGESPQSPSSNRSRAGAGSRSSRNAGLSSSLGASRPLGRCAQLVRSGVLLPVAKGPSGSALRCTPWVAEPLRSKVQRWPRSKGRESWRSSFGCAERRVRSSSGRRRSGAPSRPRAAGSVPCRVGQSWWPLPTGDGGDLSRPVPGFRLVSSRSAGSPGEGGTVVPRKMVSPRV